MSNKQVVHPVQFYGFYSSPSDGPHPFNDYGDHRDNGEIVHDSLSIDKLSKRVNNLPQSTVSVVDFGGGKGKVYNSLKHYTDKKYSYKIIDLPEVFCDPGEEVEYLSSVKEVEGKVDIFYTDATFFLTKGTSFAQNVHDSCKLNSDYMILDRTIIIEGGKYESFYTFVNQFNGFYYSIIQDEHLKTLLKAEGYKLIEERYSKSGVSSKEEESSMRFEVNGAPPDLGLVTYKDYVFQK